MSGGHWDYEGDRAFDHLRRVGMNGELVLVSPKLAQVFRGLSIALKKIEHDLDWHFSGDTEIDDFAAFEAEALGKILGVLGKKAKFKVYEMEEEV